MAIEGKKYNINCNVIVPTAGSRLTEDILPPGILIMIFFLFNRFSLNLNLYSNMYVYIFFLDFFAELKPELIAPVVVWLCHEDCAENGSIIESAAGWATKCKDNKVLLLLYVKKRKILKIKKYEL